MPDVADDRYLRPHRDAADPAARWAMRPGHILRASIPLRTAVDDPITQPGFLELDTVAHRGHTLVGDSLWTPSATGPVNGRTVV